MKESYGEGLANHLGPEPYADHGNMVGVALGMGTCRPAIELRKLSTIGRRPCITMGKATRVVAVRQVTARPGGV
jgi:hypothetical protein